MPTIIESIELEFCTISRRDDGIIVQRFVWEDPYSITAEVLQEFDDTIKKLANGDEICILSIPGLYGSMTPAARKVKVFKDTSHTIAIGLIIKSLSQRLLANFFFKINHPPYPVKFFKNEIEATLWLREQYNLRQSQNQVG